MMAFLFRSSLLLSLFWAVCLFFMRHTTFFRFNRVTLLAGTAACLLLAVPDFSPVIPFDVLPHFVLPAAVAGGTAEGMPAAVFSWNRFLYGLYLAGVGLVLCMLGLSLLRTLRVLVKNRSARTDGFRLTLVEENIPSFSFLDRIVISSDDFRSHPAIFEHEKMHVRFFHSADLLLFSAVAAAYWFNPFVWIMRAELQMLHEYEADEAVIRQGIDATQYQLLLVKKAVGAHRFRLASGFFHSKLKNRINMMQTNRTNRWAGLGYLACLPLLALALCLCSGRSPLPAEAPDTASFAQDTTAVPFNLVDTKPSFNGKDANEFSRWVAENTVYPKEEVGKGLGNRRVTLSFTVTFEGNVTGVKVLRGSGSDAMDAEAVRVISASPKWEPGRMAGKPVSVTFVFPVMFREGPSES